MTTKKSTEPATSAVTDQRADQTPCELFVFGQDEEKRNFVADALPLRRIR